MRPGRNRCRYADSCSEAKPREAYQARDARPDDGHVPVAPGMRDGQWRWLQCAERWHDTDDDQRITQCHQEVEPAAGGVHAARAARSGTVAEVADVVPLRARSRVGWPDVPLLPPRKRGHRPLHAGGRVLPAPVSAHRVGRPRAAWASSRSRPISEEACRA